MNKKKQFCKLSVLSFAVLTSMSAFAVQDVYEYKNKEGVIEFTDQANENKKLEKHIQIPKTTPEQEAQSKEKLDAIMAKDKELDKKLAQERKLENERLNEARKAQLQKPQVIIHDENSRRNRNPYYPDYPGKPGIPGNPIERPPTPANPIHKPGKSVRSKAGGRR